MTGVFFNILIPFSIRFGKTFAHGGIPGNKKRLGENNSLPLICALGQHMNLAAMQKINRVLLSGWEGGNDTDGKVRRFQSAKQGRRVVTDRKLRQSWLPLQLGPGVRCCA